MTGANTGTGKSEWIFVGSSVAATYVFNTTSLHINSSMGSSLAYYMVKVDSTSFPDGPVQLKVVADTAVAGELTAVKSATIANTGIPLCYTISDQDGQYPLHIGESHTFTVADCSTDATRLRLLYDKYRVTSVAFYAEVLVNGLSTSKFISKSDTAPYSFQTTTTEYKLGTKVTFKAVVKSESRDLSRTVYMTSTTMTGKVIAPFPTA